MGRQDDSFGVHHPERPDVVFTGSRSCRRCRTQKPVGEFQICFSRKRNTVHLSSDCKKCRVIADNSWKERNPAKAKRKELRSRLRARYGLELVDYERLLVAQHGMCAVCGKPPATNARLHIDHDHVTGQVRALLCNGCNSALGYINDCPETLRRLADYIEFHKGITS